MLSLALLSLSLWPNQDAGTKLDVLVPNWEASGVFEAASRQTPDGWVITVKVSVANRTYFSKQYEDSSVAWVVPWQGEKSFGFYWMQMGGAGHEGVLHAIECSSQKPVTSSWGVEAYWVMNIQTERYRTYVKADVLQDGWKSSHQRFISFNPSTKRFEASTVQARRMRWPSEWGHVKSH